jgi:hypothetical protein
MEAIQDYIGESDNLVELHKEVRTGLPRQGSYQKRAHGACMSCASCLPVSCKQQMWCRRSAHATAFWRAWSRCWAASRYTALPARSSACWWCMQPLPVAMANMAECVYPCELMTLFTGFCIAGGAGFHQCRDPRLAAAVCCAEFAAEQSQGSTGGVRLQLQGQAGASR